MIVDRQNLGYRMKGGITLLERKKRVGRVPYPLGEPPPKCPTGFFRPWHCNLDTGLEFSYPKNKGLVVDQYAKISCESQAVN